METLDRLKPKYKFYATLLDAYAYFLQSEAETAFQEFINKLNRVPFTSEAAAKGTAFNEVVDAGIKVRGDTAMHNGFEFKGKIVNLFIDQLQGHAAQIFTKGLLPTSMGFVELYGYIDKVRADTATDIKTTGNYTFPKYLNNYQHLVYPYCLQQEGNNVTRFKYMVTDFNNYFEEDYIFRPATDLVRLQSICESLITFIETHRALITDKKLFALDVPVTQ